MIRQWTDSDIPEAVRLWNEIVEAHEVVYAPMTETSFLQSLLTPLKEDRRTMFVDEADHCIRGIILGSGSPSVPGSSAEVGFLTAILVRKPFRGQGIGRSLLQALEDWFRSFGYSTVSCGGSTLAQIRWIIPGTPGHDHNNAPGMDEKCAGFPFLQAQGYSVKFHEIGLYLNLRTYSPPPDLEEKRKHLSEQGIYVGVYDASLNYDYDGMCDRVGSEYWREVLHSEIDCHHRGKPNTDPRFIPDGKIPDGPRPILVATCGNAIVAQTGPVDLQASGRGWFTGICTDPLFEKRGIATVLFHTLLNEFIKEGASFSTIFTGSDNHARKIYERAGFRAVRPFAIMAKDL